MKEYKRHPDAGGFRVLSGAQWKLFLEDLRVQGQRLPIYILDGMIIDGWNRYLGLKEIGRKPKFAILPKGTDAKAFVQSMNVHRRHLTGEERESALTKALQAEPQKSNRRLAEEIGVSHTTVVRHRKKLESGGTIVPPDNRTGIDGKSYSQKREPLSDNTLQESGVTNVTPDKSEIALEKHKTLREIADSLAKTLDRIDFIRARDCNPFLDMRQVESRMKDVIFQLRHCAPYRDCPFCARKNTNGCKVCRMTGWITKEVWDATPGEYK